ncbi:MAG TPA: hypothetical protein DEP12_11395 [Planctomycetaceae bacterium]|nr:hypothetical protein [Planctomycetaceae bacterium]
MVRPNEGGGIKESRGTTMLFFPTPDITNVSWRRNKLKAHFTEKICLCFGMTVTTRQVFVGLQNQHISPTLPQLVFWYRILLFWADFEACQSF